MFLFFEHKITMASGISGLLVKVVGLADAYRKEVEANKELKDELKELKEENAKLKRRVVVLEMRSKSVSESEGQGNIKKKLKLEDSEDLTQQYSVPVTRINDQPEEDDDESQSQTLLRVFNQLD